MSILSKRLENVEEALRRWRETATMWHSRAAAGTLNAHHARQIVDSVRGIVTQMASVPRTEAAQTKAVVEWQYQGDLAADFTAIETAFKAVGNWVAARDSSMWTGYDLGAAYPWTETVPTFTAAQTSGLQTALNNLIAAIDTFLANIP